MNPIRVALVGCGAIAQNGYLPALALVSGIRCSWLVDTQKGLAEKLAEQWGISGATDDYQSVLGSIDAAILAVPNHLHAPMTLQALARKIAVLCEKPLCRTKEEALRMVQAAHDVKVPLIVGMTLRQYPGLQHIQSKFPWATLGEVREVRASFGFPLDWPLASPYLFDREKVGGGVLIAEAIHLIDALFWMLSLVSASVEEYWDDGETGVESEARGRLALRLPHGRGQVPCFLEASRVRRLANRIEVVGEKASLVIPLSITDTPQIHEAGNIRPALDFLGRAPSGTQCFATQLECFVSRIRGEQADCADGQSQVRVLELIESCYALRKPLVYAWQAYRPWGEDREAVQPIGNIGSPR